MMWKRKGTRLLLKQKQHYYASEYLLETKGIRLFLKERKKTLLLCYYFLATALDKPIL